MRRSSAMFTSGSRGAIRSATSSQQFASSSTLSSVTSSRFITSTSSTSSISTLLQSQRAASSSGRGLTLRSSLPSSNSTSTASFLLNRSISSKPRSPILETAAPRSSIYGIGNNSTSLLAPLTVAAAHAAGLATSAKAESDESEESSSRNRPSSTSSPPDTSHLLSSAPNLPPSAAAATPAPPAGRIRTFIKKYGAVGVVTYFGIYGATLASFYGAFSSGILFAGDVVGLIEKLHLGDLFDESLLTPKMGNFALAWIVTKFTEPLRFALTLGVTPAISRWWRGHHQHRVLVKAAKDASAKASDKTKA